MSSFLEIEDGNEGKTQLDSQTTVRPARIRMKWLLLSVYCTLTALGNIGGPMFQRLYYLHGGNSKWLSSWLQSAGFLFLLPPLSLFYFRSLFYQKTSMVFFDMIESKLLVCAAALGIMIGLDNYMYSAGLSSLPVSTSALLFSTQLSFTALFAFVIVKQKFTFYSINAVVAMTLGAIVLALHTSGDRPPGVSQGKYLVGFFLTLGGAALLGLILPLLELTYSKSENPMTYVTLLQFQFVVNFFATIVCTVGMLINKDFETIPKESRNFKIGKVKYYEILVVSAIFWQIASLGIIGVIHCASSLFAGIFTSVLLPFTELAAVLAYNEKFTGEKGMTLAMCLWGFTSYFIGEHKKSRTSTT
ncbi:hypothetical protein IFM89_002799 [Coptis chinensis]|uniref:Probable purine permease n=1 Tax=Coptis chinensis TaxID=261450 RepID=A0A835HRH9_9MAGN|nr:hypothetical protein IFM89_002799 [Coptis chinensis]